MFNATTLGKRIRELRGDVPRPEFAKICGVTSTYIGLIERGQRIVTLPCLYRIAKALKWHPRELL